MSSNTSSEIPRLRQSKMDRMFPKLCRLFSQNCVAFVIIFVVISSSRCSATSSIENAEDSVIEKIVVKANDNSKNVENQGTKLQFYKVIAQPEIFEFHKMKEKSARFEIISI